MPSSKMGLVFLDYSGETSRVDVPVTLVTAGNFAATAGQLDVATPTSLAAIIAAVSLCTPIQSDLMAVKNVYTSTAPASQFAQRELGLLIEYQDNVTTGKYRITIPGPDWATIGLQGTDLVNTDAADWVTLRTALQTVAVSPLGNAITVLSGRLVGRNR